MTELTQKQLQLASPKSPPSTSAESSSSSSSLLPGAKGGGGGDGGGGGGSDEITIGEILGLAVAMFSLAGERCVESDEEMTAWRVGWLRYPYQHNIILIYIYTVQLKIFPGQKFLLNPATLALYI